MTARRSVDKRRFETLTRQRFRRYFQPSRVVIGVLPAKIRSGFNLITLCFDMHCSYKPTMMAFAVQRSTYSYSLLGSVQECVLAVPGEKLAEQAMFCGLKSGRNVDKVTACELTLVESEYISVPGIAECIANIELKIRHKIRSGDHLTVISEVKRFSVDKEKEERPLLSIGPDTRGYQLLARHGIHRLGVVASIE